MGTRKFPELSENCLGWHGDEDGNWPPHLIMSWLRKYEGRTLHTLTAVYAIQLTLPLCSPADTRGSDSTSQRYNAVDIEGSFLFDVVKCPDMPTRGYQYQA